MPRFWFSVFLLFIAAAGGNPQARAQSNDNFANRLALTGSHPTAVSNNLHATREAGEPNHAGAGAGRSLWYTWTAPASGTVNIGTYETTTNAPTMRAVAVYTGSTLGSLTEVASSNDLAQLEYQQYYYYDQTSGLLAGTSINVPVTAGTVYQIAVDSLAEGWYPDDGTTVLAINAPPTVVSAANATGTTGASFSYTVVASGGPTAYAATGLPAGLVINAATGLISGPAVATGTYTVGLSATGPGGTGTATLTLRFNDPVVAVPTAPVIENELSLAGYVGVAVSTSIEASGNPTAYAATTLPDGLTLNTSTGALAGTPTAAGIYTVPISATNAVGTSAATLTINITTPSLPIINSALAASGTTGTSFTYYIETNLDGYTGLEPTGWTATNLPPGLTLNTASGSFSGTPTQAGTYTVPISATNVVGTRQAVVTLTISDPPAATPATTMPVLSSRALAQGVVGTAFGYTLGATQSPTGFGASNLPAGLTFNASSGAFAGTPTAAGTFLVPVTATNAYGTSTGTLTVTIFANAIAQAAANGVERPVVVSAASTVGYVGRSLSYGIAAQFEGSPYFNVYNGAWTFSATGLPPGLSVTTSNGGASGFGTISGTPTQAGTYQATITVTTPTGYSQPYQYSSPYGNAYHPASTGTAVVTFIVNAASASAAPVITSSASFAATVGSSTSLSLSASGSPTSYAASNLPPGLTINTASGLISGTPTQAGTYAATVSATNSAGTGTATITFPVTAPAMPTPVFTGYATASGSVGASFSYYLSASNSPTGYTVGSLPPGLSYSATGGHISGTPTTAGAYSVPIGATNANGTTNATLTITIYAAATTKPPSINSSAIATGTTGQSFYYYIETDSSPTSYGAGSPLPPGLTFSASTGYLSGTPTTAGTYTVPISATNANGTGSATLTVVITNPGLPVFTSACALSAALGQSFSSSVYASNSPTAYTFSGLPPGITQSASSSGYLTGTPTQAGTYSVAVGATNASGTATASLTIMVAPPVTAAPPVIGSAAGASGYVGGAFSYAIQASGSPTSYAASGYPSGLSFNTTTGLLSGKPTAAGTYAVAVSATNSGGTGQATVSLVVSSAASGPVLITSAATVNPQVNETFYYAITANAPVSSFSAANLPAGVTLNTSTGLISGKLAAAGTYTVPITATGPSGTASATLTIENTATYYSVATYPAAASGLVSQAFSLTLTCNSSGTSSTSASPLPAGLSCNSSTGVISGTPTAVGTTRVTVTQYTANGTYVNGTLLITIGSAAPTAPVVSSAAGATAFLGLPFYYYLQATNSPTAFYASGLPAGLILNPSTGLISGTPTSGGTYSVSVYAQNPGGTSLTATMSIYVAASSSVPAQVTSAAEVAGAVGSALSYTVADGSNSLYYVSASGLPPGLSVGSYTSVIGGTPTTAGTYVATISSETSYGSSSTASVTFNVTAAPTVAPTVTSAAAAAGTVGAAFSYTLAAIEATTLTASSLPAGLSFNATTGVLSGTPTAAGSYAIPLTAANSVGTGSATLNLTVAPQAAPTLSGGDPLEWTATVGTSSSNYLYANGTATSYGASGLPPGLSINAASGLVSGMPTTAGTYPVTVSVANATGSASAVVVFVVSTPSPTLPSIDNLPAMFDAFVGAPISTVYVSNGGTSISFAASGLPPGLSLNPTSGQITGTPTTAGVYSVNLSASNAAGSATEVWTVVVHDASVLYPAFSNLRAEITGTVGQSSDVSFYVYADYGGATTNAPVTLAASGLPTGVQLSGTGSNYFEFYGTPTTAGTYPVAVTATAPGGATTTATSLLVVSPAPVPTVTSAAGAVGNVNSAFSYSLSASNTVTSYSAGTLPAGLTLNPATGQITGTPTTAGTTAVPVSATGPYGTASGVVTIRVDPPLYGGLPVITSAAAINSQDFVDEGEPYYYYPYNPYYTGSAVSYTLAALNGPATYKLTNLPAGLVFNSYNNTITGQPVASGVFQVAVTATNAAGSASATLTIISGAPLAIADPPLAQSGYVGGSYSGYVPVYYPTLGLYSQQYGYPYYLYNGGYAQPDPVTFTAAGLPPGLSINSDEGAISGTFTQAGSYPVTIKAGSLAGTGSAICTFTVAADASGSTAVAAAPTFGGQAQAAGFLGVPLSYYLYGSGASSYAAAGLPAGLALNVSTGQIKGTPTATGVYPVTVSATNATGSTQATLTVTVEAAPPAPQLEGECTATATLGTAFYYYIDAYGPYSSLPSANGYAASGLPAGLSLNAANGEISGTPTGPAGVYAVPVTAFVGPVTAMSGVLTLTVQNPPAVTALPVMTSAAGALGWSGNPFFYTIYNPAFIPDTGSLPPGLSYNAATGIIGGYPTATGTYTVPLATAGTGGGSSVNRQKTIRRSVPTDSGTASLASMLTINVLAPDLSLPRLTAQPGGGVAMGGSAFTFTAAAVGAPAPAYQWRHNGVAVPGATGASLTLNAVQPADSGAYTVTASNAAGSVTSNAATLLVQTTFARWQAANFSAQQIAAGLAADNANPSGDGISNLLKYALGLDPNVPAGGSVLGSVTRTAGGGLQITFTRDAGETDINYVVEAAGDLGVTATNGWTTMAEGDAGAALTTVNSGAGVTEAAIYGTSRVQVTVQAVPPTGAGSLFLRLRVVRP